MLSTVSSVKEYTGYDVTLPLILRAQAIIEMFVGKDEIDVESPSDLLLLDKMVSYQTAYMLENEDLVFKQIATSSISFSGSSQSFDRSANAPYIAPLAILAARGLSWSKARSIKTGKIFQWPTYLDWKKY
jgi:hypothetical protein